MPNERKGSLNAKGLRLAIVVSRFNQFITNRLLQGALDALGRAGTDEKKIEVVRVPGSFEIPVAAKTLAQTGRYDALICLGCIIRGETQHFDYISAEVTRGIQLAAIDTGVPMAYGVLTTDTLEQAVERAGAKSGNKGADAALSAVEMANLLKQTARRGRR
ncbi:MAG: 6,7-dimethyl-8-ribityllumazine synthase [Terriglobia bacterium]